MTPFPKHEKPMRPREFAEHRIVTAILDGTYPPGAPLPGERDLAEALGITRPTLRETLQRLSREGWIRIHHGKPSVVNDYWQHGGLSLLGTLATYGEFLPNGFIDHLLEVRLTLLPEVAGLAMTRSPGALDNHLTQAEALEDKAEIYGAFDWGLQICMTRGSGNPIFPLILNDFTAIYRTMGHRYFTMPRARLASAAYYRDLRRQLKRGREAVEQSVRRAMAESIDIWQQLKQKDKGKY
ncbi:MAG: GntR family transcriptional regulator [Desulfobacterales bacterium]|nr:GntR family transcriptional regulator [Desulfobacterales bacterium]